MDKMPVIPENGLLAAALDVLRGLGLVAREDKAKAKQGDLLGGVFVSIGLGIQPQRYVVELRRTLRPANLGAALHELDRLAERHGLPGLLVADHITPELAEALREQGREFADAAGNAHIRQPGTLIYVTGRKPAHKTAALQVGRAFQPTGLQVIFALLCHPEWINLPYRELAARAGVAHGTVGWVMPDLQQQGFITEIKGKRGTRRLYEGERLLALWVDAYTRQLRPRLALGRYFVQTINCWRDWPLAEHAAQWGGEPAGALLTQYLKPAELTLYAEKLPGLLAGKYRFMKEADAQHRDAVEVRRRFWNFPETANEACVPPVLVYADLLATGDARCIETAKRLYEEHVVRLVRQT
jgi:hypothetical protein